ncbi:MAG: aminoacyl-histidine dipeptidase [Defluviitaleaceae bacterium]|nr:aminoacyl-histidine dipeptidase [Defluviitaleaceae bacterium]
MSIENLEPKPVFKFFSEISAIPRASKNEREISDYLLAFAESHGLWAHRDEHFNVIIRKPASAGYENVPTVILQSHTDMVCEKNNGVVHDFEKDGLKLVIDGEYLRADGTTLGADNGAGVAYSLALLDDNTLAHPPIEALFTADEEVGMTGVQQLDHTLLTGRRLINLDSGEEGIFFISCAGGMTVRVRLPVEYADIPDDHNAYTLSVSSLIGGHSGVDVHKEQGNANRILSRILCSLDKFDFYIAGISGGAKDNAIPREAEAVILIKSSDCAEAVDFIVNLSKDIKAELSLTDPAASISIAPLKRQPSKVYTKEASRKIALMGSLLPIGVQRMCKLEGFEGLVESSANIGVVIPSDNEVEFRCSLRSSVASRKHEMARQTALVAEVLGANAEIAGEYPAWELDPDSWLQRFFQEQYEAFTCQKAEMAAIHAGLECGWFAEHLDKPDMISLGPNMYGVHSPTERLEIKSTARVWEFLKFALANMKE